MLWCLTSAALIFALLGIAMLKIRFHRPRFHCPRPGMLVRGCAATVCLLVALGLSGLAFLVAR